MLSACVKWAKTHMDGFNALLERQLSGEKESSKTYMECMSRAHQHAAMLSEVGLDFKDLVGRKTGAYNSSKSTTKEKEKNGS
jgi:exocyst complex component 8